MRWLAVLLLLLASAARGETLPVAGDSEDLWIAPASHEGEIALYHRAGSDPANQYQHVIDLNGRLAAGGLAVEGHRAWLVFQGGAMVESIRYLPDTETGYPAFDEVQVQPNLPPGVVLSVTAGDGGPWALVRINDPSVLAGIDGSPAPATQGSPLELSGGGARSSESEGPPAWEPAVTRSRPGPIRDILTQGLEALTRPAVEPPIEPATAPAAATSMPAGAPAGAATAPAATQPFKGVLRLLHLQNQAWVKTDMPESIPAELASVWLVMRQADDARPAIISAQPRENGWRVHVYRNAGKNWSELEYTLDHAGTLAPLAVDGQMVIAQEAGTAEAPAVKLVVLDGAHVLHLGDLALPSDVEAWGVAPMGQSAVVVGAGANGLTCGKVDLLGHVTPVQPMVERQPVPFYMLPGYVLQMGTLIAAMVLMFAFWRRDAEAMSAKLPPSVVAANLVRRGLAAAVDLTPCILVSCLAFHQSLDEFLSNHWPRAGIGWSEMAPGLAAIGLFVLYGFLAELFTATTLGKQILGLRVVSLDGGLPNLWQVLARNFLKAFDLIALPLLLLPLLRPHGQRLGDLVARTLVVQPGSSEDERFGGSGGSGGSGDSGDSRGGDDPD